LISPIKKVTRSSSYFYEYRDGLLSRYLEGPALWQFSDLGFLAPVKKTCSKI